MLRWMNDPSIASGAKNRALPVLSSLFQQAQLRGVVPPETNPCVGLRRKERSFKAVYLSEEDFAVLGRVLRGYEVGHPQAVAAIRFLALTGCRKAEAFGLTASMIDGNRAALPDAKAGPKTIWLGRATRRVMKPALSGSAFAFGTLDAPVTDAELKPVWQAVKRALGKPNLRLHDLRHSFASVAVSMGHDLVVVGGLLGHKDKGSTAGYVHLANKDVEAASHRVGQHLGRIMRPKEERARKHRSDKLPAKPKSIFAEYLNSKDRLSVFCKTRSLDPDRFQTDLRVWRQSNEGAAS